MRKVVVSGATSMIGLAFINECILKGTYVVAIVRNGSKKTMLLPKSDLLTITECNLESICNMDCPSAHGSDAFYHFAWSDTDRTGRVDPELQQQNIMYTLQAVNLASNLSCSKFIGAGSQAEYGRCSGTIPPDMRVNPDSAYGVAKYAAGRLAMQLAKSKGLSCIWGRIFSVYGPHDHNDTMIMYCIRTLLRGETPKLTPCEQQWDYLYSQDAGRAFYLMGESGSDQSIYNVGSGQARPLLNYVNEIRDQIDSNATFGIGEIPYSPNQVMELCADISNLKCDTGFVPEVSFEEGIRSTIEWVKNSHKERLFIKT